MGAGEGEVFADRYLGIGLADETFSFRVDVTRRAPVSPATRGQRRRNRRAPQLVGSGEKSSWRPLYLILQFLQASF